MREKIKMKNDYHNERNEIAHLNLSPHRSKNNNSLSLISRKWKKFSRLNPIKFLQEKSEL